MGRMEKPGMSPVFPPNQVCPATAFFVGPEKFPASEKVRSQARRGCVPGARRTPFPRPLWPPWKNRNGISARPEGGSHRQPAAACVRRSENIPICRWPVRITMLSAKAKRSLRLSVKVSRAPLSREAHNAAKPCRGGLPGWPLPMATAAKKGPGNLSLNRCNHGLDCISARYVRSHR